MALKYDEIAYPKTSFSKILKYGENKQSHVFTINNTIVIKNERSQFLLNKIQIIVKMDCTRKSFNQNSTMKLEKNRMEVEN